MRLIRGHKSTTVLQKISDDSAAARAGTVRPKSRSILQFLARPATKSKGYGRLILRRKVARVLFIVGRSGLLLGIGEALQDEYAPVEGQLTDRLAVLLKQLEEGS